MGNFYTNVVVTGADGDAVVAWMRARGGPAFVEVHDGVSVVFDAAGELQDGSHIELAQQISKALACRTLAALNHDDDVLRLDAFVDGEAVDTYDSCPSYFDFDADDVEPPAGGDRLAELFGGEPRALEPVLAGDFVFAVDRHESVLDALGLPSSPCGLGYANLASGERPPASNGATLIELT